MCSSFLMASWLKWTYYNFVGIYSSTSHPFGFSSKGKKPPQETLKFIVTNFRNKFKKVELIRVDKDGKLAWSS